jgi:hypothetical protein
VILRAIRGRASTDELAAFHRALAETLGPDAAEQGGPERYHLASRPAVAHGEASRRDAEHDALVISRWSSAEAAASGDARKVSPLVIAQRHLRDLRVEHFEIDDSFIRRSEAHTIAIRLATGRFSRPGADAQMQALLRERAPLIGEEMTEAYVGRRMVGPAVEVTFVSAWSRPPTDRPLEEAFWPDIALRYDEFRVEVYATLGVQ